MKSILLTTLSACVLAACAPETVTEELEAEVPPVVDTAEAEPSAAETLASLTPEQIEIMNKTPITSDRYPGPPEPHYGPEYGSITFVDTDPGPTIGGTLTMKPAVDENGMQLDEAEAGITMYMIHWGLEVGEPGVDDDKGAGDLGGDCMGFRDTGHVVMMPASEAGDVMQWDIPQGTEVPDGAVYFVGHTLYGEIHNLEKCTQTPINNMIG
ncbi:MAG: hypothetical protein QNI84_04825 [Henriciella sp.]|nr:hypothetical protein [Henriciella sp.]